MKPVSLKKLFDWPEIGTSYCHTQGRETKVRDDESCCLFSPFSFSVKLMEISGDTGISIMAQSCKTLCRLDSIQLFLSFF